MTTTTTWLTADWHLGHERIIELCDRPFGGLDEMHDEMVRRHNELVAPEDVVLVLGDAVMGRLAENLELVTRFNGRLWLLPGNHDRLSPAYHHTGDREAKVERFRAMYLEVFERVIQPDPVWDLGGHEVQLSHFPYEAEDERDQRHNEHRVPDAGLPLVHGHVHNSWKLNENGRELNVGVDVWGFRPVSGEQVLECLGLG